MELKDKIIMIRKQNFLSQEGLAEKLNVTRQTVSKWELGETKPSIDVLNQISELFNVSIEELTSDKLKLNNKTKVKKPKNRKYILYILIVILIASVITLAIRIGNERQNKENSFFNFFNSIFDSTKELDNKKNNLLLRSGTKSGFLITNDIDEIIENNKTNKDHLIEVIFDETTYSTDPDKILEIKSQIADSFSSEYEVSLDYDKDDYINKVTIKTIQTISTSDFNNLIEFYSGTQHNPSVRNLLDEIIKSNNKHKTHLIEVVYQSVSYGTSAEGIKNAKSKIGTNSFNNFEFITYEVSLDYDESGYVIKVTIEEL